MHASEGGRNREGVHFRFMLQKGGGNRKRGQLEGGYRDFMALMPWKRH